MLDKHIVYLLMICSKQQQQQLEEQMQSVKNGDKKTEKLFAERFLDDQTASFLQLSVKKLTYFVLNRF